MRTSESGPSFLEKHHPIRKFWQNYQWFAISIGVVIVFFLGAFGFMEYFSKTEKPISLLDIAYRVIQLFVFGLDPEITNLGWKLEIARWLAPIIAAYTAVRALAVIFGEQLQLFRLQFLRKHIIICGLGKKGLLLARRFQLEGFKVVVIESDENNENLQQCRDSGAIVLIGSAMEPDPLRRTRLEKAEYLFCVCGDDGVNAEIAFHARVLLPAKLSKPLTCVVHIIDPQLCRLLKEREFETERHDAFRLEFFNLFDYAARTILDAFPPFNGAKEKGAFLSHLLIVGIGNMGESLVVHAVRKWIDLEKRTGKKSRKLTISIIDRIAKEKKELLNRRYPRLKKVCRLEPLEMNIHSKEFEEGRFLFNSKKESRMNVVYVCLDNDSFALRVALSLHQQLRDFDLPIIVRMDREAGLAPLIEGDMHGFANIQVFGLLDRVLKPELLLTGTHEILARAIHEEYRRDRLEKGETIESNPSLVAWEELPETLKNSNRRQADYMGVKLKTVGCYIVPMTDWNADSVKFTADEIESMSQMEHDHWMKERLDDGWKHGAEKDIKKKISPFLVPWDDLPEEEKEKDRNPVREMPNFLSRAGFQIYRRKDKRSNK